VRCHRSRLLLAFYLSAVIWVLAGISVSDASAQQSVVRAIMFQSRDCAYCQGAIAKCLWPLSEKYGARLQVLSVSIDGPTGKRLFDAAVKAYEVPGNRRGVPAIVVGHSFVSGGTNICERFPTLVTRYLEDGGTPWPDLPGLASALEAANIESDDSTLSRLPPPKADPSVWGRLVEDPLGAALGVFTLLLTLASLAMLVSALISRRLTRRPTSRQFIVMTLLVIAGLGIAGYMAGVEHAGTETLCPVGDCSAVQSSSYARLFGLLSVAYLGVAAYALIGASLLASRFGTGWHMKVTIAALLVLCTVGTLFSMYLTAVSLFAIGASCFWCLSSSVIMACLVLVGSRLLGERQPHD